MSIHNIKYTPSVIRDCLRLLWVKIVILQFDCTAYFDSFFHQIAFENEDYPFFSQKEAKDNHQAPKTMRCEAQLRYIRLPEEIGESEG